MKHSQSESALATSAQQTEEAAPSAAAPRELPPDWWGHRSGFVMGGVLGSASERKVKEREPGFSEADQEGLYHLVNVSPCIHGHSTWARAVCGLRQCMGTGMRWTQAVHGHGQRMHRHRPCEDRGSTQAGHAQYCELRGRCQKERRQRQSLG